MSPRRGRGLGARPLPDRDHLRATPLELREPSLHLDQVPMADRSAEVAQEDQRERRADPERRERNDPLLGVEEREVRGGVAQREGSHGAAG